MTRASLGDVNITVKGTSPISPPPLFQFDFQSQVLSSIQHGTRTKKVEFTDITGYTSEVSDYLGGIVMSSYLKYTYFVVHLYFCVSFQIF